MFGCVTVLCAFFMTSTSTFITKEEVEKDALVRFHWSESNKMRNNTKYGADVRRRAAALDGQLAIIMKPPFGPFWCKNPRRIVIQSLDDPDIILAVKMRNLESVEPIKIHVFHARNDSWWSDEYSRKEKEICDAPGNDYVITHQALGRSAMGELQMESDNFVNNITFLSDPVDTVYQWMTTIKMFIADVLWETYQDIDSSSSFDDGMNNLDSMMRFDGDFREHLKIHLKSIHRHGGIYQEMRWPPNNRIGHGWLLQGMHFAAYTLHDRMIRQLEVLQTLPTSPTIHPSIIKMIRDVVRREEIEFNETLSAVFKRSTSLVRQQRTGSLPMGAFQRRFLSTLIAIPQYVSSAVKRFQEVAMLRDIGETFARLHPSLFQGSTIAIAVPGEIIPKVDRLKNFLYRVIKRLGLKYKCKVEVFEIQDIFHRFNRTEYVRVRSTF